MHRCMYLLLFHSIIANDAREEFREQLSHGDGPCSREGWDKKIEVIRDTFYNIIAVEIYAEITEI